MAIATQPQTGSNPNNSMNLQELFSDPNFLNLLAGVGGGLDPEGVGGILGKATIEYNKAKAAQHNAAKILASPQSSIGAPSPNAPQTSPLQNQVSDLLTPPGQPGITSVRKKADGSTEVVYDPTNRNVAPTAANIQTPSPVTAQVDDLLEPYLPKRVSPIGIDPSNPTLRRSLPVSLLTPNSSPQEINRAIVEGSVQRGLDPLLVLNLIEQKRVNPSEGLTPQLAQSRGLNLNKLENDPQYNLDASLDYLKELFSASGGSEARALLGYSGGDEAYPAKLDRFTQKNLEVLRSLQNPLELTSPLQSGRLGQSVQSLTEDEDSSPEEVSEVLPAMVVRAKSPRESSELEALNDLVGDIKSLTRSVGLTERDLRGLDPKEVDAVVKQAQNQQLLSIEVGKLIGTSTEEVRKRIARNQRDLTKLRLDAAKNISQSGLNARDRQVLLDQLSVANSSGDIEIIELATANAPKPDSAGVDRDALASELFYGNKYYQLKPEHQAVVNQELDKRTTPTAEVVTTEQGVFVVNKRTGKAKLVTLDTPQAPGTQGGPPTSPSGPPSNVSTPPTSQAPPTSGSAPLSDFAKSVSSPPQVLKGGEPLSGKAMNETQAKAFGYGTRALQAHEISTKLESDPDNRAKIGEFGTYFRDKVQNLNHKAVAGYSGIASAGALAAFSARTGTAFTAAVRGASLAAVTSAVTGLVSSTLAEPLASLSRTPEERQYLQAKLDFMSSILRKESGAAITVGEFLHEDQRYFPQVYDDPQTIKQKELARQQVINVLRQEAGRPFLPPLLTSSSPPSVGPTLPSPITAPTARAEVFHYLSEPGVAERVLQGKSDEVLKRLGPTTREELADLPPSVRHAIRARQKRLGLFSPTPSKEKE